MSRRWVDDLVLGARLTVSGGRDSWMRTALTAVGVGLGVAMLLLAASVPTMLHARHARETARSDYSLSGTPPRGERTVLVADADSEFRDQPIRGRVMMAEGAHPAVPPGLSRLPGPGQLAVSPALARLLASPEGALLRPRLSGQVVATIGTSGLTGPHELAFYLGSDALASRMSVRRIDHFGDPSQADSLDPVLMMLVAVLVVVLLLPIAVFIATAVRFAGAQRDRRLAALRLVGADGPMTARIAAGEAVLGAVLGVLVGGLVFLASRRLVGVVTMWQISVYPSDVRPSPLLTAIVVAGVPLTALLVTFAALRRVVIEPLGVVRRAGGVRRRLWWRLVLPAIGVALLYPLFGSVSQEGRQVNQYQIAAGVVLLLVGTSVLLPWLIEGVVRRLGGGAVPWQLAVRRLQMDSGAAARVVNGVVVAVAGAIALQTVFVSAEGQYTERTGQDPTQAQLEIVDLGTSPGTGSYPWALGAVAKLRAVPGVRDGYGYLTGEAATVGGTDESSTGMLVGDCAVVLRMVRADGCADGDVFLVSLPDQTDVRPPAPGTRLAVGPRSDLRGPAGAGNPENPQWTIPTTSRAVLSRTMPDGGGVLGVVATPGAVATIPLLGFTVDAYLTLATGPADAASGDVIELVRNAAAGVDPAAQVQTLQAVRQKGRFTEIERGLLIGAVAVLLLTGASLLVSVLEQLRERRRLLAVLVAFGTRRSTLSWSVLAQTALPVLLGLALAVPAGAGLGALLLLIMHGPMRFAWVDMAAMAGTAAAVVLLVTALSLPALWRMTRPDGLRTE